MKAISISDLSFGYLPQTAVLSNVSLDIEEGAFIGLVGPNGGGKTTLLKLILGFLQPEKGEIEIFGEAPKRAHRFMSYVPQHLHMDRQFPITVLELVLSGRLHSAPLFGGFRRSDREMAHGALKQVSLDEYANSSLSTLSGGQLQRALIARALVSQPRVLLMDEPTSSLDPHTTEDLYELFRTLKGKMTILMITHNLGNIIKDFDRVLAVQQTLNELKPEAVCQHFTLGVYHPPLIKEEG